MMQQNYQTNQKQSDVLHFDDDESYLKMFKKYTEKSSHGVEVISVRDPGGTLELVKNKNIIGIVTDSFMLESNDNFLILQHFAKNNRICWLSANCDEYDENSIQSQRAKQLAIEKPYRKGEEEDQLLADLCREYTDNAEDSSHQEATMQWTDSDQAEFRTLVSKQIQDSARLIERSVQISPEADSATKLTEADYNNIMQFFDKILQSK